MQKFIINYFLCNIVALLILPSIWAAEEMHVAKIGAQEYILEAGQPWSFANTNERIAIEKVGPEDFQCSVGPLSSELRRADQDNGGEMFEEILEDVNFALTTRRYDSTYIGGRSLIKKLDVVILLLLIAILIQKFVIWQRLW